jgi:hypothetical protein
VLQIHILAANIFANPKYLHSEPQAIQLVITNIFHIMLAKSLAINMAGKTMVFWRSANLESFILEVDPGLHEVPYHGVEDIP